MKNFVKAMNNYDESFKYLKTKYPRISDAKLKIERKNLYKSAANTLPKERNLNMKSNRAWDIFVEVCYSFPEKEL